MNSEDIDIVDCDAPYVDVVICWRYTGQRCHAGTRLDLKCSGCNRPVVADKNSQRYAANGAKLLCRECLISRPNA